MSIYSGSHYSGCNDERRLIAIWEMNFVGQFLQATGYSEKTGRLYHNYLRDLLDFFVQEGTAEYIKPYWANCGQQVISRYALHLKEKGNSPATISQKMAVINSFFDWLYKK